MISWLFHRSSGYLPARRGAMSKESQRSAVDFALKHSLAQVQASQMDEMGLDGWSLDMDINGY
jgi:hypothetical protein